MRQAIESAARGYAPYEVRYPQYHTADTIPFRVSPEPFPLTRVQQDEIRTLGGDVTAFVASCDALYRQDQTVKAILDTGKPELFLISTPTQYAFVRPDLIITPSGFALCEIETSPFGLGLAEILNRAARREGFETMVEEGTLASAMRSALPTEGTLVYSEKTRQYRGQLTFLADQVFSASPGAWKASSVADAAGQDPCYRGFYLSEYCFDDRVREFLEAGVRTQRAFLPSLTAHMEEKALLGLLWDRRWEGYFHRQLGAAAFSHLRTVVPPTWIVGQEAYFSPGLPAGVSASVDLASLSRAKRTFVLKSSGFSRHGSWSEGVSFLQEQSQAEARHRLEQAVSDPGQLFVVQEFRKAAVHPMVYETPRGLAPMAGRVRLTPYYSTGEGRLIALKATAVEPTTNYIHASSHSVNTAVA